MTASSTLPNHIPPMITPLSVAVLSGKGGSGKTLICLSLLRVLHHNGPTLLVDADPGTGGLSYFLSLEYIKAQGPGLLGLIIPNTPVSTGEVDFPSETYGSLSSTSAADTVGHASERGHVTLDSEPSTVVRRLNGFSQGFVVPIGDITRFIRTPLSGYQDRIGPVVEAVVSLEQPFKVFDCRGGIDKFTLHICRWVDLILVVTETDIASVQSTKNLLDVLKEQRLDYKIGGYCINRLFDDASHYNRFMSGLFEVQFLGGIPFDIESMRRFLVGRMPRLGSPFVANGASVAAALFGNRPDVKVNITGPVYTGSDFAKLSLRDPREVSGQAFGASLIAATLTFWIAWALLLGSDLQFAWDPSRFAMPDDRITTLSDNFTDSKDFAHLSIADIRAELNNVRNNLRIGSEETLYSFHRLEQDVWAILRATTGAILIIAVLGLCVSFESGRRMLGNFVSLLTRPFMLFRGSRREELDG